MSIGASIDTVRSQSERVQVWAEGLLAWKVWQRLLESEFVDRSVALAGKAFVSFFPVIIVVAAFMPSGVRASILATMSQRLGLTGPALTDTRHAFAATSDIKRATGVLGLVLTIFFATGFTTALQRVYLQAWRRAPASAVGKYLQGLTWTGAVLIYLAVVGKARSMIGTHGGLLLASVPVLLATSAMWWFTSWLMLSGQVRWRVLLPSGMVTGLILTGYVISASIWMPNTVQSNEHQFGFFGIALALVTWFSGAATCIMVGACSGAILAEDPGVIGRFVRGAKGTILADGAPPSLPEPARALRLADAFSSTEDADLTSTEPEPRP